MAHDLAGQALLARPRGQNGLSVQPAAELARGRAEAIGEPGLRRSERRSGDHHHQRASRIDTRRVQAPVHGGNRPLEQRQLHAIALVRGAEGARELEVALDHREAREAPARRAHARHGVAQEPAARRRVEQTGPQRNPRETRQQRGALGLGQEDGPVESPGAQLAGRGEHRARTAGGGRQHLVHERTALEKGQQVLLTVDGEVCVGEASAQGAQGRGRHDDVPHPSGERYQDALGLGQPLEARRRPGSPAGTRRGAVRARPRARQGSARRARWRWDQRK